MEDRLDAQQERMNVISDNLKKTHTLVCENNEMLKQIIKHFDIE
jgi:flagellar basal body rod protein FlgC